MRKTVSASVAAACALFPISNVPAQAHVKWFLSKPLAELLQEPKPYLFNQWCACNVTAVVITFSILAISTLAAKALKQSVWNTKLIAFAEGIEPWINAFVGICTGICLVHCAINLELFAPNFIICSHCPKWLPYAESMVGAGLILGLATRISALGMLALLAFTFMKHTPADCLDLVPLYGVGLYFLFAGRNRYSLDYVFGLDKMSGIAFDRVGHFFMRVAAGLGLMILALDEKLVHPQLALDLIHRVPTLNFMHPYMTDDMFVLAAGLTELVLGFLIAMGTFPRIGVLFLSITFLATTFLFGSTEVFGHAPYYGIVLSIFLRGSGLQSAQDLLTALNEAISCQFKTMQARLVVAAKQAVA